jgi:hypothetical protein
MKHLQTARLRWRNAIKLIHSTLREMQQPLWLGTIIWYLAGFGARATLIFVPGLTLLDLLKSASTNSDVKSLAISISANILLMLIGGWLIFTVLVGPNSTNFLLPDAKTRKSFVESFKMIVNYNFALTCGFAVYEIQRILTNSSKPSHFAGWNIVTEGITAIAWLIIQMYAWNRSRHERKLEPWDMSGLTILGKASTKIQQRLTPLELNELGGLLYESREFSHAGVQSVTRTIWLSIILAGIIEILREIGVRLIGTILK